MTQIDIINQLSIGQIHFYIFNILDTYPEWTKTSDFSYSLLTSHWLHNIKNQNTRLPLLQKENIKVADVYSDKGMFIGTDLSEGMR